MMRYLKMSKQSIIKRTAIKALMKAGKTKEEAEAFFNELTKIPISELNQMKKDLKKEDKNGKEK